MKNNLFNFKYKIFKNIKYLKKNIFLRFKLQII